MLSEETFQSSHFRKSSFSPINQPYCVEVAMEQSGVAVRNSQDPDKRTIIFTKDEWKAFLLGVKSGEFDV